MAPIGRAACRSTRCPIFSPLKMQVASIPWAGGAVKYLSEGDAAEVSPDSKQVAFIRNGQAWVAPVDGSAAASNLFTTRGTVSGLQWSPDETIVVCYGADGSCDRRHLYRRQLVAEVDGGGVCLGWVGAVVGTVWCCLRTARRRRRRAGFPAGPGRCRGVSMSPIRRRVRQSYMESPVTLRGSYPTTDGGPNLHWAAGNTIVFLFLSGRMAAFYSVIRGEGGSALPETDLLTPGAFMCEHIKLI